MAKRGPLPSNFVLAIGSVALDNTLIGSVADEISFLLSSVLLFTITGSVALDTTLFAAIARRMITPFALTRRAVFGVTSIAALVVLGVTRKNATNTKVSVKAIFATMLLTVFMTRFFARYCVFYYL